MSQTKYLIVGSSHAGLSALEAIRLYDREGPITMISREKVYPYSPTILPYVVSGKVKQDRVFLRDQTYFDKLGVTFRSNSEATGIDPAQNSITLKSGETVSYERCLIATGAVPQAPPIPGLNNCPSCALRTLDDALRIRKTIKQSGSAIILGAGLIGMHAAENMARAGMKVTVVEMLPQVLPGYFDPQAAALIEEVFAQNGVKILTGHAVTHISTANGACGVSLENGLDFSSHMLLVATGVRPCMSFLKGSAVQTADGILVDERMRTSAENVWAAGDVAQAGSFAGTEKILNGILPDAVEQGRIAGMDMAQDPALKPYPGGIPMNTYSFFGNRSFSVGTSLAPEGSDGFQVDQTVSPAAMRYQKLVFREGNLMGAAAINAPLDPGIMEQMIRRQVDLADRKGQFAGAPRETGRLLMSGLWR